MIQQQTLLNVSDNSGAKVAKCIKVLGGFKKKIGASLTHQKCFFCVISWFYLHSFYSYVFFPIKSRNGSIEESFVVLFSSETCFNSCMLFNAYFSSNLSSGLVQVYLPHFCSGC